MAASRDAIEPSCAYVPQHEQGLMPSLTVRETLQFAAQLRLPAAMTMEEKQRRADKVMAELGLSDCADVRVGDASNKGISGGERRRVSIAIQLLNNPNVLILDEPTSGLDVFTASAILAVLRGRAERGQTVITTVHQASRHDFDRFDNVVLMARGGRLCYTGPRQSMLTHLARLGLSCPLKTNPADFALDLLSDSSCRECDTADDDAGRGQAKEFTLVDEWRNLRHLVEPPLGQPWKPPGRSLGCDPAAGQANADETAAAPTVWDVYKVLVHGRCSTTGAHPRCS